MTGTGSGRGGRVAIALVAIGLLAACGGRKDEMDLPAPPKRDGGAEAAPRLAPAIRLSRVVDLLTAGDEATARVELRQLLEDDPASREGRILQQSVDGDPRQIVPRNSFSYIVQPGETFQSLAENFLGDRYKFYALARISGIAVSALKAGDVVQIPGRLRDAGTERASPPRPRRPRLRVPSAATTAAPTPAATAPTAPAADPAAAQQLRRQGLERLSAGQADRAVAQLQRAQQLDPDNKAIAADLARARRVQSTVRRRN